MWSYCAGVFDSSAFDEELQVIGGDVLEYADNDRGGEIDSGTDNHKSRPTKHCPGISKAGQFKESSKDRNGH